MILGPLDEIKTSVDIIAGSVEILKNICYTVYDFLIDPFGTLKIIADPIFLVAISVLILMKAMGFKDSDKYIKFGFLIYIIILLF